MASIFKKPRSPYYFAAFRDARGQRRQKSTKLSDRGNAMRLALEWERLAESGRQGSLTESACRKVVSELLEQVTGKPIVFYSVESWLAEWIKDCEGTAGTRTLSRYHAVRDRFIKALGERARLPLPALAVDDVRQYRDTMFAEGRSGTTCNQEISILRSALDGAFRMGFMPINPAANVSPLKDESTNGRKAFTVEQIATLLAATKGTDWEGCIMLGALCGLRLVDASNLTWADIDFSTGILTTITSKRGVKVQVPMHPALIDWLKSRPRGIGKAPILPSLHGKCSPGKSMLSMAFSRIMEKAGVIGEKARDGRGKGRNTSTLSFHSTRHYFVSALSAGGVAADTRQRLAGHTDAKSHAVYSKHEMESLRAAIATLPTVGGAAS